MAYPMGQPSRYDGHARRPQGERQPPIWAPAVTGDAPVWGHTDQDVLRSCQPWPADGPAVSATGRTSAWVAGTVAADGARRAGPLTTAAVVGASSILARKMGSGSRGSRSAHRATLNRPACLENSWNTPGLPASSAPQCAQHRRRMSPERERSQPHPRAGRNPHFRGTPNRPSGYPADRKTALFLEELLNRLTGQVRARRGTVRRFPGRGVGERGTHQ